MQENTKSIVVKMTARRCFRTEPIWQYDGGHVLTFEGFDLPMSFEVHFSRSPMGNAIPQIGTNGVCTVPEMFTQNAGVIYAWLYIADVDSRLTKYSIEIPVAKRAKPTNQEPTPVEQSAIDQAIAALNAGVEAAEDAQEAAEAAQASAGASATSAAGSATAAGSSATDANASRQAADVSATNAGVSERAAAASAAAAASSASGAAGSASAAAGSATAAAGSATAAAGSAAQAAQTVAGIETAGAAQVQAVNNAGSAQVSAVNAKGQEVLDSIPSDYSELTEDVNSLMSAITELEPKVDSLEISKADVIISSASGAIASFSDGADGMPVKELTVAIEPVQDLHGYDHPWPGGGNKNKFSGTWPSDVSGTYAGWNTGATTVSCLKLFDKGNGADISGIYFGLGANGTTTPVLWVINNGTASTDPIRTGTEYGNVLFPYVVLYPATEEALNKVLNRFNVMVSIDGEDVTTYSPYANICPISGWDAVKVTRTGANLLPTYTESVTQNGITYTANADGSVTVNGTATATNTYTAPLGTWIWDGAQDAWLSGCPAGGNYYNGYSLRLDGQSSGWSEPDIGDGIKLDGFSGQNVIAGQKLKFCIVIRNGVVCNNLVFKPMLNFGNSALPYEEYKGMQTYSIALPSEAGTVYGGELTVNEDGTGTLVVDTISAELTGDAVNTNWGDADRDSIGFYMTASRWTVNTGLPAPVKGGGIFSYCHNAEVYMANNWWAARFLFTSGSFNRFEIRIPKNVLSTQDVMGAKAYLNEHPLQAVYKIAPQTYTLTAFQVQTILGTNNIWADAGDVSVSYRADTKLYIDNKITQAIAAALNA